MKDSNERPLPSGVPVEDTFTISEFLHSVHHPKADMTRATIRFGQYAFNQYRKQYGRPPYTRRINGNGPVKVYLDPIDYIFLSHTYEQWRRRHQGKEHA
ncbi:hypothetical protein BCHO_0879 [Bifidobacterium choerinum]|uniref:Uncharacterized protein n=1 Tax=Bifidobacterium choerinum TaxID=35760 RepID=A0A087AFB0_9BIFI|nr:hypothetical protein BCHO_0879 [Bifidobacterium choerinum]